VQAGQFVVRLLRSLYGFYQVVNLCEFYHPNEINVSKQSILFNASRREPGDFGLTINGTQQVLNAALQARLTLDTLVISSDFKRCRETAEIMHSVLACEQDILISTGLRERVFGDFELQDIDNYEQVWQHDLDQPEQEYRSVESVSATLARGLACIQELESRFFERNILLVSHGDVLQILLAHFQGLHPRFHRSLNAIANADIRSLPKPTSETDPRNDNSDQRFDDRALVHSGVA